MRQIDQESEESVPKVKPLDAEWGTGDGLEHAPSEASGERREEAAQATAVEDATVPDPAHSVDAPIDESVETQPTSESEGTSQSEDALAEVNAAIHHIRTSLDNLVEKQALAEKMHETIQQLRADQIGSLLLPGIRGLSDALHLIDDVRAKDYSELSAEERTEQLHKELNFLESVLLEAIDSFGFSEVEAEEGGAFISRQHLAKDKRPTGDRDADKTIANVLRRGFSYRGAGKTALPAHVVAYTFDKNLAASESSGPETADTTTGTETIGEQE